MTVGSETSRDVPPARLAMVAEIERLVRLAGPRAVAIPEPVLDAMLRVPREAFVPEGCQAEANADKPLPIGAGQTISQPFIVALMTALIEPRPGDRVLEIGTGSGYQTAVLSLLVADVHSIEILPELSGRARGVLEDFGAGNVTLRIGNGYEGWPEAAPFDKIIVTAAPDHVPEPLLDQLALGGRMVIPIGRKEQTLMLIERAMDGAIARREIIPVRFVPLTGAAGALE